MRCCGGGGWLDCPGHTSDAGASCAGGARADSVEDSGGKGGGSEGFRRGSDYFAIAMRDIEETYHLRDMSMLIESLD